MADPSTETWRAALGQSISAQLSQTQRDLAASQADLTIVEAERDRANELTDKIAAELRLVTRERDSLARRCAVRFEEAQALKSERDALAQHNAELTAEVLQAGTDRVKHAEREQQLRRMLTDAERDLKAAGDDAEKRAAEQARYIAGVEHDLEHARFERDRARSWQVARNDDTGACFLCGRPIVRGQAVEPQPGTTKGSWSHVECPGGTR